MAHQAQINNLKGAVEKFQGLNHEAFLRPDLGSASLKTELDSKLKDLINKIELAVELAPKVSGKSVSLVQGKLQEIINIVEQQSKTKNNEYVNRAEQTRQSFEQAYDEILDVWPSFLASKIESSGILQESYEKYINELKNHAESILKEAENQANEIEGRARKTAQKISVKEAQDQFLKAKDDLKMQIKIWAFLSLLSICCFFGFAAYFYLIIPITTQNLSWQLAYYTVMRITVLTGIGALSTYSLKILRASLHMFNHNLHRQRVANSISAFVESAASEEQRDILLAHLVDSVISFGNSGLISNEADQINPQKMVIDNIMRGFSSSQKTT